MLSYEKSQKNIIMFLYIKIQRLQLSTQLGLIDTDCAYTIMFSKRCNLHYLTYSNGHWALIHTENVVFVILIVFWSACLSIYGYRFWMNLDLSSIFMPLRPFLVSCTIRHTEPAINSAGHSLRRTPLKWLTCVVFQCRNKL